MPERVAPQTSGGSTSAEAIGQTEQRLTEPRELVPIKCEATGTYCGRFGIGQLVAAGLANRCCRSYWSPAVDEESPRGH